MAGQQAEFLTIEAVSELLSLSPYQVRQLSESGHLPTPLALPRGNRGHELRWERDELRAAIKRLKKNGEALMRKGSES